MHNRLNYSVDDTLEVVEYVEQAARLSAEKPVVEGRLETSEVYSRFRAISHRVSVFRVGDDINDNVDYNVNYNVDGNVDDSDDSRSFLLKG